MLEVMASCLTYYPVTFQRQLGYPMRRKRFVPTPGVAAASRRPRRPRLRHRPAVARRLRHGRPPRVDGGAVVLPRAHRARPDDRRVGRRAHGRRGDRSRVRVPHPERADRRRRERRRDRPFRAARRVRREPARRGAQPRPAVPDLVGRPSAAPPGPRTRRAHRRRHREPVPDAPPPNLQRRGQAPSVAGCRSRACGCST